jgi:RHS repeat-associated protein
VTEYTCNKAGDVNSTTVTVREVAFGSNIVQQAQTRVEDISYDEMGRVERIEHFGPGVTTYVYDKSGRVTEQNELIAGDGSGGAGDQWATTSYSFVDWPGAGQTPTMTEKLENPDPASDADAGRPTIVHTYDWVGNEISKTDPQTGLAWLTAFDAQNRVISTTTPDPSTDAGIDELTASTTYTLTSAQYSTTVTDPAGVASITYMDSLGRKTKEQTGSIAPTLYSYDAVGNVTRVEQKDAGTGEVYSWTENDYNALHKPTVLREPAIVNGSPVAQETLYDYDNETMRLHSVDGPLPNSATQKDVVRYTWDRSGRLDTSEMFTRNGESYLTYLTYDDAGERVRIKSDLTPTGAQSPKRQIRDYGYNYAGLVATVTERHGAGFPHGAVATTNTYSPAGWLIGVDSERWAATTDLVFAYDDLGRETSRSRSGGPTADTITTTYLKNGSVDSVTRGGVTFDYSYDGANRATKLSGGGSETQWTFNPSGAGEGLLQSVRVGTVNMGTTWQQTSFTYYGVGEQTGSAGQLKTIDDPFTAGTTTYEYDAAGRVARRTDTAGLTWDRTYEPETSNPDTQTIVKSGTNPVKTFAYFDLDYDVAGNVTARVSKLWAAGTTSSPVSTSGDTGTGSWSYGYDGAGRMVSAAGPSVSGTPTTWSYAYDGQGNRLSESDGSLTTTYTTDDQGWPVSADRSVGNDLSFTHEADGNLTGIDEAGGTTNDLGFTYDSWGGTDAASKGATTVDYTLDAFGRTSARGSVGYHYQGASEDLVRTVDGSTVGEYLSTPGGPMAQVAGGVTSFYLRDLHGDVVGTIAPGGNTLASTAYYSAYGERSALTGSAGLYGYQGDLTDQLTGTVDMLTRNYLPSIGRFTSRDVLQGDPNDPPSLNQFVYVTGSPISFWDPLGMDKCAHKCDEGDWQPPGADEWQEPTQEETYPTSSCSYCDGSQTASVLTFAIPIRPDVYIVRGGWFIRDAAIENHTPGLGIVFGATPDLLGDNRGFSPNALASDYRIFVKLNYRKGIGTIRVNPTCPEGEACKSARSFDDSKNQVSISTTSSGAVRIGVHTANSVYGGGLLGSTLEAQTIDGVVTVTPTGKGSVSTSVRREGFPSFELYQRTMGPGRRLAASTVILERYSEGSPYTIWGGI